MVSYDYAAGKSVPLPDAARALLDSREWAMGSDGRLRSPQGQTGVGPRSVHPPLQHPAAASNAIGQPLTPCVSASVARYASGRHVIALRTGSESQIVRYASCRSFAAIQPDTRMRRRRIAWRRRVNVGRPVEIIGRSNHPRADRVLLDVSQAGEPIPFVMNQQVAIPAVPQGADALVSAIEIPDVTAAKLFHRRWQADRIGRRHEHVIVRVHQRVSMHAQTMVEQPCDAAARRRLRGRRRRGRSRRDCCRGE